jgi:hypothetical protein
MHYAIWLYLHQLAKNRDLAGVCMQMGICKVNFLLGITTTWYASLTRGNIYDRKSFLMYTAMIGNWKQVWVLL